jgi:hypothetical protein
MWFWPVNEMIELVIQCLSWNNIDILFFNFTYLLTCLRIPPGVWVPQLEYHWVRQRNASTDLRRQLLCICNKRSTPVRDAVGSVSWKREPCGMADKRTCSLYQVIYSIRNSALGNIIPNWSTSFHPWNRNSIPSRQRDLSPLHSVQSCSGAHLAPYPMDTRGKAVEGWN